MLIDTNLRVRRFKITNWKAGDELQFTDTVNQSGSGAELGGVYTLTLTGNESAAYQEALAYSYVSTIHLTHRTQLIVRLNGL